MAAALKLKGIRKSYGQVVAVAGIDLEVAEGEFFTLLGPSGSGKTTLLRLIAGFERPDAGSIELGGHDISSLPPYLRNTNTTGVGDVTAGFGNPTDRPVVGDWNGDGTDTIGVSRGATFYLRNTNTTGTGELSASFGDPSDWPIVGDWNGDHIDTIGIVRRG